MPTKPVVVVMAGGTGGHVFPALATAEVLKARGYHIHWLGTERGIEARLVPAAEINISYLTISGVRGKGFMGWLAAPLKVLRAIWQSRAVLKEIRPVCVLGMGGFAAAPGGMAAKLLGIPLVIHEQNATAGSTNKLLARFANRVLQAFPNAFGAEGNGEVVGNPIRETIVQARQSRQHQTDSSNKHVLVLGGSQGALALNQTVPTALLKIAEEFDIKVWHQSGERSLQEVQASYQGFDNATVAAFIDDMAAAYAWADVVICRSGALTVSEIAAAGLPSILVPFPHAIDDHQTANAKFLVDADAAVLMPQSEMSEATLVKVLAGMFRDAGKLLRMSDRAFSVAKFGAADKVADVCMEIMREH